MIDAVGGYRNLRYLYSRSRYQRALRAARDGCLVLEEADAVLAHIVGRADIERQPEPGENANMLRHLAHEIRGSIDDGKNVA